MMKLRYNPSPVNTSIYPSRTRQENELIKKYPFGDKDKDGVSNYLDCRPLNKNKKGFYNMKSVQVSSAVIKRADPSMKKPLKVINRAGFQTLWSCSGIKSEHNLKEHKKLYKHDPNTHVCLKVPAKVLVSRKKGLMLLRGISNEVESAGWYASKPKMMADSTKISPNAKYPIRGSRIPGTLALCFHPTNEEKLNESQKKIAMKKLTKILSKLNVNKKYGDDQLDKKKWKEITARK